MRQNDYHRGRCEIAATSEESATPATTRRRRLIALGVAVIVLGIVPAIVLGVLMVGVVAYLVDSPAVFLGAELAARGFDVYAYDQVGAGRSTPDRDTLPDATLVDIQGAGHAVSTDQPQLFTRLLETFLDDQPLPLPLPAYTSMDPPPRRWTS